MSGSSPRIWPEPDRADLLTFAHEHLADFKVPRTPQRAAEPLPRNAGGKVLKPVLREETVWT